ncbi:MAG: hypothetical protein AABN34_21090 [Acidobacteriota bacterium]
MTTQRRSMLVTIICAVAVLASVAGVGAQAVQERTPPTSREVVVAQGGVVIAEPGQASFARQGDNTFVFVSSEMSIDGKLVKGAPYSAQAVTETVQTLADGNRIVRRTTAAVYRDGEGRTRREQTIGALGAYAAAGEPQQTIFINDPVAEVNYVLEAKNKIARKIALPGMGKKFMTESARVSAREEGDVTSELHQKATTEIRVEMGRPGGFGPGPGGPGPGVMKTRVDPKNTKKESLGKQTVEGVEAEGTRFTTTIAAGEVGNEAPIYIISERWYSPELQTLIMSKNSDPRMGETTYRLTSINRSEPAHSLFEVPSDYTIKEGMPSPMRFKIESELRRPGTEKKDQ